MQYRELVSVSGLGGLYQLITTKSDGAIVRDIADQSTKFVSARLHHVTPLESIEVYTIADNVRLQEVFLKMKENDGKTDIPDGKKSDGAAIKNYFKTVFPDFDEDRVYVSDMKKMIKWYHLLKQNDLLDFEQPEQEEADTDEEAAEEAPKAKKATKKAAKADDVDSTEEKPAKKTATKKKAATKKSAAKDGEEKPAKKTAKKKKEEE